MNIAFIVGNLTAAPERRVTQSNITVTSFTVAVNNGKDKPADFFRVSTWRNQAESCFKYLSKGSKVAVVGRVSASAYNSKGEAKANLEINASEVEFLSKASEEKPEENPADSWATVTSSDIPF